MEEDNKHHRHDHRQRNVKHQWHFFAFGMVCLLVPFAAILLAETSEWGLIGWPLVLMIPATLLLLNLAILQAVPAPSQYFMFCFLFQHNWCFQMKELHGTYTIKPGFINRNGGGLNESIKPAWKLYMNLRALPAVIISVWRRLCFSYKTHSLFLTDTDCTFAGPSFFLWFLSNWWPRIQRDGAYFQTGAKMHSPKKVRHVLSKSALSLWSKCIFAGVWVCAILFLLPLFVWIVCSLPFLLSIYWSSQWDLLKRMIIYLWPASSCSIVTICVSISIFSINSRMLFRVSSPSSLWRVKAERDGELSLFS